MSIPNIAIIGAGITGLTLAQQLSNHAKITLFEKSRGVGGRMATRYSEEYQFDHGAPFFTARTKAFRRFLKPYIDTNTLIDWQPKLITLEAHQKPYKRLWFEPHYVASPKMNMLCKSLMDHETFTTVLKCKIETLQKDSNNWYLTDDHGSQHGPFNWVIITAPAPQAQQLLPSNFKHFQTVADTPMVARFSLMLGLNKTPSFHWQAAKVNHSPIDWIYLDSAKPNRNSHTSLLIQSTAAWSETHIEANSTLVYERLIEALQEVVDLDIDAIAYQSVHRWRYASIQKSETEEEGDISCPEREKSLMDEILQLGVCGDWCIRGDVESGYLSSCDLAAKLKVMLPSQ